MALFQAQALLRGHFIAAVEFQHPAALGTAEERDPLVSRLPFTLNASPAQIRLPQEGPLLSDTKLTNWGS